MGGCLAQAAGPPLGGGEGGGVKHKLLGVGVVGGEWSAGRAQTYRGPARSGRRCQSASGPLPWAALPWAPLCCWSGLPCDSSVGDTSAPTGWRLRRPASLNTTFCTGESCIPSEPTAVAQAGAARTPMCSSRPPGMSTNFLASIASSMVIVLLRMRSLRLMNADHLAGMYGGEPTTSWLWK